jgi:hypothetical protein
MEGTAGHLLPPIRAHGARAAWLRETSGRSGQERIDRFQRVERVQGFGGRAANGERPGGGSPDQGEAFPERLGSGKIPRRVVVPEERRVSGFEWIVIVGVMAFGALVQSAVGFGLAMVVAPFLVLIDPLFVPGPLLAAALLLTVLVSLRDRRGIDVSGVGSMMVGRVLGTVPGALLIARLPIDLTRVFLGLLVLGAVAMSLSGLRLRRNVRTLFGVGIVSGFMSATVAIGGPPVALAYQDSEGRNLRGTLAFVFTFGTMISIAGLFFVGRFGTPEIRRAAILLPGTLIGFLISGRFARILDEGYTRNAVLAVSSAAAIVVLIAAVL